MHTIFKSQAEYIEDPDKTHKLYQKSHGMTRPGEQLKRNYDWEVDVLTHTFGKSFSKDNENANTALTWEEKPTSPHKLRPKGYTSIFLFFFFFSFFFLFFQLTCCSTTQVQGHFLWHFYGYDIWSFQTLCAKFSGRNIEIVAPAKLSYTAKELRPPRLTM